jgi:Prokaryotic Cytochrome C oxidase subunit IV
MDTDTAEPVPTSVLDGAKAPYPREKLYVFTAMFLAVLTAIEVATYLFPKFPGWDFGGTGSVTFVLLLLMAVKFFTVAYIFMHLRFDKRVLTVVFYAGVILAGVVYVAVLTILNLWYHGHPHP